MRCSLKYDVSLTFVYITIQLFINYCYFILIKRWPITTQHISDSFILTKSMYNTINNIHDATMSHVRAHYGTYADMGHRHGMANKFYIFTFKGVIKFIME